MILLQKDLDLDPHDASHQSPALLGSAAFVCYEAVRIYHCSRSCLITVGWTDTMARMYNFLIFIHCSIFSYQSLATGHAAREKAQRRTPHQAKEAAQ